MNDYDNLFKARFTLKDVTIHNKERVYKHFFAIDDYTLSYKRYDGSESRTFVREIFERDANAVAILCYDKNTDEIALIEQFRPGALNDPVSPWLIEIVAGMIDKGGSEVQAAIREVKEEIGVSLTQKQLVRVTAQYPTPGGASELTTLFIADTDLKELEKHGGLDTEGEDIRVFKAPLKAAYENVLNGRIHNSVAIIGIQHMMLEKDKVLQAFAK